MLFMFGGEFAAVAGVAGGNTKYEGKACEERLWNRWRNNPCFVVNGRIENLEVEHSMIDER